jgi:beta-N-acetylhexosaminidase
MVSALPVLLPGFDGTTLPPWLERRLADGLAGVCLFGQNVESDEQLRDLTASVRGVRGCAVVASDEEGGSVTRMDLSTGSPWPGAATLGALDDLDATYDVARGLGARARDLGIDLVLAPVLDVNSEPDNPVIGVRSFGASTELVSRHGAAFVRGLQDAGVVACGKHFPGHGATRTDSHVGLPVLEVDERTWRERDLPPFEAAVAAGIGSLMTAHVVVRALDDRPATLSPTVLGLLRTELGFDGVVVTDALDMRAISGGVGRAAGAVQALAAGADLVCIGNPGYPEHYDSAAVLDEVATAVEKAVADGVLPAERLAEAAGRVAALQAVPSPGPAVSPASGVEIARRAVTVRGDVRLGPDAVVVATEAEAGYAAGRVPSALLAQLRERRPAWPVLEVPDVPAERDVLVVVEGLRTSAADRVVRDVLAVRPDAVVVYGGLARPDDPGDRSVHTHGTGLATAVATVDLLLGEAVR